MAKMQGNPEYKDNMDELTREPATPEIFNRRYKILLDNDAYMEKNKLDKTGDAKDITVTFVEADSRENILSVDRMSTLLGKIKKWFSDLKTVAFSGSYKDLSDKPTAKDIGLGNVGNYKAVSTVASQGLTDAEKANARGNIEVPPTSHASTQATYGISTASVYGHAMAGSTTPKANGTAAVGGEVSKFARADHVHPSQEDVSGNAGTATKLKTARTIQADLGSTSAKSFDGSANVTPGVTGILSVANGGTGRATLTANYALVGNGTGAASLRAIDTTSGGTASSTSLITSGAVKAGLNAKIGNSDFLFVSAQKSCTNSSGSSSETIAISNGYKAVFVIAQLLGGSIIGQSSYNNLYVKSFSQSGTNVAVTFSHAYFGAVGISVLCVKI